jgi:hypothetical protein
LNHLNSTQKFLISLSVLSLVVFIGINIYITFSSSSNTVLGVNVSDEIESYDVKRKTFNPNLTSTFKSGVVTKFESISYFETDQINFFNNAGSFVFLPNKNLFIHDGVYLMNISDSSKVKFNNSTITSVGRSKLILRINRFDIHIYVLEGNVFDNEGVVAEKNQKLTWVVDQFGVSEFTADDFAKDSKILDLIYDLYEIKSLPVELEEFKPGI